MGTQLKRLAAERAPKDRLAMLEQITAYGETDLLCYRANEPKLAQRQAALFDPVLKTLAGELDVAFDITRGVMPVVQPTEALKRLWDLFAAASDRELAALFVLTPLLGSALLSLALWKGFVGVEGAIEAATLDEAFQAEEWVEDAEEKARRDARAADIRQCALFLNN